MDLADTITCIIHGRINILKTIYYFKAEFSFPSVHVSWADACIVVYAVGNSASFEAAATMLEGIQNLKMPFYLPVLLLANQKDLEHYRQASYILTSRLTNIVNHDLFNEYLGSRRRRPGFSRAK